MTSIRSDYHRLPTSLPNHLPTQLRQQTTQTAAGKRAKRVERSFTLTDSRGSVVKVSDTPESCAMLFAVATTSASSRRNKHDRITNYTTYSESVQRYASYKDLRLLNIAIIKYMWRNPIWGRWSFQFILHLARSLLGWRLEHASPRMIKGKVRLSINFKLHDNVRQNRQISGQTLSILSLNTYSASALERS